MTPRNLDELAKLIDDQAFVRDAFLGNRVLDEIDAAGLAIVPKEATEEIVLAVSTQASIEENYRAMVEASPFRGKE